MDTRPKKSYGQNFLINESISQKIASYFLQENECSNILEIGPGKGALTKYLLKEKDLNFKAVEADWDMVQYLLEHYKIEGDQLIQEDFLKLFHFKKYVKFKFCTVWLFDPKRGCSAGATT